MAAQLARREQPGGAAPDVAEIAYALRQHGAPYVWPRAWVLDGASARASARERMGEWLANFSPQGERRCGVAALKGESGREVVVALAADVLADFEALPSVTASGSWLDVRVRLLVPATAVKLVVLAPRGRPHSVPSTQEGELVRGRFRADRSGMWLVQALATVAGGPRPIAEAVVFADTPPSEYTGSEAPGEEAAARAGASGAAELVFAMVNGARASEGVAPLRRDARLDRLADEHARAMLKAQRIAHDLGGGDPGARVSEAGIGVRAAGENVAHAASPARAHRALWASPSHRENLLLDRFDAVGVGVAEDEDGTVWVCELFAALR